MPVLVTPDQVIGESEEILAWTDQHTPPEHRLFPEDPKERDEVLRLSRRFDAELGPRGRRLIYVHMLPQRDVVLRFNNQGVPPWEDGLIRHGWPLVIPFMRRVLGITPGIEVEDEQIVWREFDFAADTLERARALPVRRAFQRRGSDICRPLSLGDRPARIRRDVSPQQDEVNAATASLVQRAREHPAGAYALRLFAECRRERVVSADP